jgi:hypothetical protein
MTSRLGGSRGIRHSSKNISLIFIGMLAVVFVAAGIMGCTAAEPNLSPAKVTSAAPMASAAKAAVRARPAGTHRPVTRSKSPAAHNTVGAKPAAPAPVTRPTTPVPVARPTTQRPVAPSTAPSTAPPPPAPTGCYPLSNGGRCYEPGEFCRDSDHGVTGVAGDGERIVCEDNDGWRWEPE